MTIPVLVEPSSTGFVARTGSPLDLSADGATADATLAALRGLVSERLRSGTQIRTLSVGDVDAVLAAAGRLSRIGRCEVKRRPPLQRGAWAVYAP